MSRPLLTAALTPVAVLGGAAVAVGGVALHQWWWGLAITWVSAVSGMIALPPGWLLRAGYVAGFASIVWLAATTGPGGDLLVADDLSGYGLIALVPALVVVVLVTHLARARALCGDDRGNEPGTAYRRGRD